MFGVSYDGLTAAMTLLHPHPALKAISEQASPADQWMNDDDHRYGALRESYAFEYAVLRAGRQEREHALRLRHLRHLFLVSRARPAVEHQREVPARHRFRTGTSIVAHPDYDAFWKKRSVGHAAARASFVPNLNVAGFWDQEDPWGPWQIFRHAAKHDPDRTNFIVAGPWFHGQWHTPEGRQHRADSVRRPRHGARVPREDRGAVLPLLAARQGREAAVAGVDVPDRIESAGRPTPRGRRRRDADESLPARGRHAVVRRAAGRATAYREYVSDPANPVPYRQRPISPTYPAGDWRRWEVADQRFVDDRPDVLTYVSAPLDRDLTVTGELVGRPRSRRRQAPTAISSSS